MKMYVLEYTPNAIKDLRALDKVISGRILKKVKKYSETSNALVTAKALSGNMNGFYRWRVGDYRIVFSVDEKGTVTILTILHIDHRKDVYRYSIDLYDLNQKQLKKLCTGFSTLMCEQAYTAITYATA